MKHSTNSIFPIALIAGCLVLAIGIPCEAQEKEGDAKTKSAEFDIHEWGVFTAPRDALWLKQDIAAEWATFPEFFHGIWPRKNLAYRGPVTKPVVYFHTEEKLRLQFEVHFAEGRPLIWWPPAEYPNTGGDWFKRASLNKKAKDKAFLYFDLHLNHGLEKQRKVEKGHWLEKLRNVKSASVMSHGSHSQMRQHYETREQESFVYYDGLMKMPTPPTIARTDSGILLKTDSDHDWYDVVLIERTDDKLRIAKERTRKIDAGQQQTQLNWEVISENEIAEIEKQLLQSWTKQGLHEDEAKSMLEVWREGLLKRQGMTVFYRIDQDTYDAWLPLYAKPAARKIVRVGLVVHYHLEPELEANIKKHIKQLGSVEFSVRANADRRLREIGGPALKFIQQEMQNASPEVRMRCAKILKMKELEKKTRELMEKYSSPENK